MKIVIKITLILCLLMYYMTIICVRECLIYSAGIPGIPTIMLVTFACYCVLLGCEYLLHVDFIPLFLCGTHVFL